MSKLKDIYLKNIERPIQNVIKIQESQEIIQQELSEYVVTKELKKHLGKFFSAYDRSLTEETDKTGVWISGFYGSGKSHLLKILSYLLKNNEIENGKHAVDYFDEKIDDQMLLADIKRAGSVPTDVVLFNISYLGGISTVKAPVLTAFEKAFNESIGLSVLPKCAEFERYLIAHDKYEEFKNKYFELYNEEWTKRRQLEFNRIDKISKVYAEVMEISEEDAKTSYKQIIDDYNNKISIDYFTDLVKEYIDRKEQQGNKGERVIFLVDEIGQYMEDNTSLMLDLQSIIELLGSKCKGKAWLICTAQEAIDNYTKVKGNDFSKILARFDTRLSLTSSDIEEVIKKRLLEKKSTNEEPYRDTLVKLYNENDVKIRDLLDFKTDATQSIYKNPDDFADTYPFVPYQFHILQEVFENIKNYGYTGKSISRGERSLISATQYAAINYKDAPINTLIPFYAFYGAVESDLDTIHANTINHARTLVGIDGGLKEEDINVLEILFMLKNLKELPANIENIATLYISNIEENKAEIKKLVKESLERLERQTLIQRNNQTYEFLTDEEQQVNKEINGIFIPDSKISEYISDIIYGENYPNKRYTYNKQVFDIGRYIGEKNYSNNDSRIGIKICLEEIDPGISSSMDDGYAYLKPNLSYQTTNEIRRLLRIRAYRKNKAEEAAQSERMTTVLAQKQAEERDINNRMKTIIVEIISDTPIYVSGRIKEVKSKKLVERFNEVIETLINNVYTKFNYIQNNYTIDNIRELWNENKQISLLAQTYSNPDAYQEVKDYCELEVNAYRTLTINDLVNHFKSAPYGFLEDDIEYIIALLLKEGSISLFANSRTLDRDDVDTLNRIIKKDSQTQIKLNAKIDKEKIDAVKNLARQSLKTIVSDDEHEMMKEVKKELNDEIVYLKDEIYHRYYDKYKTFEYPGKEIVTETFKLFDKILSITDDNEFFNEIYDKKDNIKINLDEIEQIINFFENKDSNQKDLFDNARKLIDYYTESEVYINMTSKSDKLISDINEIKRILKLEKPYSEIPKLKDLREEVNDILVKMYDDVSKPIIDNANNILEYIISHSEKYDLLSENFVKINIEQCKGAIYKLNNTNKLGEAYATKTVIENIRNEFDKKLTEKLTEQNEQIITTDEKEDETKKVRKITLSPSMITTNREYTIKSEEDIDKYLKDIKELLLNKLQNGEIIIK